MLSIQGPNYVLQGALLSKQFGNVLNNLQDLNAKNQESKIADSDNDLINEVRVSILE